MFQEEENKWQKGGAKGDRVCSAGRSQSDLTTQELVGGEGLGL